jgi:hypothetical protein
MRRMAVGPLRRGERTGLNGLTVDVLLEPLPSFHEVTLTHDVVALKDAAGRVPQQHHGDALRLMDWASPERYPL